MDMEVIDIDLLNALMPGSEVERYNLDPSCGRYGIHIPKGVWHTVDVVFPSLIVECKDGKYVAK